MGQSRPAVGQRPADGEVCKLQVIVLRFTDRDQIRRCQDGGLHVQLAAVQGCFGEKVALPPDGHRQGRDQFLANGVQGRVGHLGEQLTEIVVEQAGLLGENGQGDIVAHGTGGFYAPFGHRS